MIEEKLKKVLEDVRRFVPSVLGVMVISDEGLPMGYAFARAWHIDDPIIVAGLISSARDMMDNVLKGFGDRGSNLVFAQGHEYSIIVGMAGNLYVGFIATSDAQLGPLFMEMRKQSKEISKIFEEVEG